VLRELVQTMNAGLTAESKTKLRANLEALQGACDLEFLWASLCSGTDLVSVVLSHLFEFWEKTFGLSFNVTQEFACENVPMKQRWLDTVMEVRHIFPEVEKMNARLIQDIRGVDVTVRKVLCAFAGVECDSISACNRNRSENWQCVLEDLYGDESSKTGTTARACLGYVKVHRPAVFLLENVRNLSVKANNNKSNLQLIVEVLNSMGYHVCYDCLNSLRHGVPQSRERFLLLSVLVSDRALDQLDEDYVHPDWAQDLDHVIAQTAMPALPLQRFLLPDDDAEVRLANAPEVPPMKKGLKSARRKEGEAAADVEKRKADDKVSEFEVNHLAAFNEAGIAWPLVFTDEFKEKCGRLPERERQVLYYDEAVQGSAAKLRDLHARDLHMTIEWGVSKKGYVPTITSSSQIWVRGSFCDTNAETRVVDRLLCGSELLALQGLPPDAWRTSELPGFSQKDLADMAGNAFCAGHLIPVLVAAMTCVPWQEAIRLSHSALQTDEDIRAGTALEQQDEGSEDEGSEDEAGSHVTHGSRVSRASDDDWS